MGIKQDRELMDALCEIDHGLTAWEVEFVEGCARQVHDQKRPLTLKQVRTAMKIYDAHLGEKDD